MGERESLRAFARRGLRRDADRADGMEFAKLADDVRARVPDAYSVYVNSNEQRIVIAKKVA